MLSSVSRCCHSEPCLPPADTNPTLLIHAECFELICVVHLLRGGHFRDDGLPLRSFFHVGFASDKRVRGLVFTAAIYALMVSYLTSVHSFWDRVHLCIISLISRFFCITHCLSDLGLSRPVARYLLVAAP